MTTLISFSEFGFLDRIATIRVIAHHNGILISDPDPDDLRPWSVTVRNVDNQVVKFLDPSRCANGGRILTKRSYSFGRVLDNGQYAIIKFDFNPFFPKDLPAGLYSITLIYYLGGTHYTAQHEFRLQ